MQVRIQPVADVLGDALARLRRPAAAQILEHAVEHVEHHQHQRGQPQPREQVFPSAARVEIVVHGAKEVERVVGSIQMVDNRVHRAAQHPGREETDRDRERDRGDRTNIAQAVAAHKVHDQPPSSRSHWYPSRFFQIRSCPPRGALHSQAAKKPPGFAARWLKNCVICLNRRTPLSRRATQQRCETKIARTSPFARRRSHTLCLILHLARLLSEFL